MAGVRKRVDVFGVLVLGVAAANSGGILRDITLGAAPPAAIRDWRYLAVALIAGLITFRFHPVVGRLERPILVFDAAGLSLFAVAGTQKALAYHLNPLGAVLLGVLTGIGGGIVRDILVAEVPAVLSSELYAVAALGAAVVVMTGHELGLPATPMAALGAALCFALRIGAITRGWGLPVAEPAPERWRRDDPPAP
jgi:uncharacterized membrane protein YeiH